MKLYFYEWKKLFFNKSFLIIVMSLIIINIGFIGFDYKVNFVDKQLTHAQKHYSLKFAGQITFEKVQDLKAEMDLIKTTPQTHYYSGGEEGDIMILEEIYNQMYDQYNYQKNNQDYLNMLLDNIEYFQTHHQQREAHYNQYIYNQYSNRNITTFDYTLPFEKLFHYQETNIFILLSIVFASAMMISLEKESQMLPLLKTSQKGKKYLQRIKYFHNISLSITIVLLFSLIEFITFMSLYGFSGMNEPLYAIEGLLRTPISCTLLQFYLLLVGMRLLAFVFVGLIFLTLTQFINNHFLCIITSISIILFLYMGISQVQLLNPLTLLNGINLFLNMKCIFIGDYCMFQYIWFLIVGIGWILLLSVIYFIRWEGIAHECQIRVFKTQKV
ncbi:MAG: hypothetical protein ACLUVC_04900 [Longibaculum sp.]